MENHGALVGWTHHDFGDKLLLCVESVRTLDAAETHQPDILRVLLTKKQAAVLGQYLTRVSGETAPRPSDRGLFRRLFG
jgi:hypothetical protein